MPRNTPTVDRGTQLPLRRTGLYVGLGVVGLLLLLFLAMLVFWPASWRAYTDGTDITYRDGWAVVRDVVWEIPQPAIGQVNAVGRNSAPTVSPRGGTMVFARATADDPGDLFISRWEGTRWSKPQTLAGLNTGYAERGPELSRDGKMLYFSSNRRGGSGGYDLWASWKMSGRWSKPFNLGPDVNSEFDEIDPGLTYDGARLYFASNRPVGDVDAAERRKLWERAVADRAKSNYDIFAVKAIAVPEGDNPFADVKFREKIITSLGGSPETEKAVRAALDWLTKNQEKDGHWSAARHGGGCSDDAVTAFAALCYMGWGARHTEEGPYQKPLVKAIQWMLKHQPADGDWTRGTGSGNGMYCHGIVTTALAEAHTLTKDPALLEPLKKAVVVILKAQGPATGGWRYTSKPVDSDTSVVGWQMMALKSAEMAGVEIPAKTFQLARKWLDTAGGGKHRGLYGYSSPAPAPALVGEGMFCQQLMGLPADHPRQQESAGYLMTSVAPGPNEYLTYYGTLAAFQHQGSLWAKWNPAMKKYLLGAQVTEGPHAGSWNPAGTQYGNYGGRVYITAMSTLTLEVYYRLLPMYNVKGINFEAVAKTKQEKVKVRITDEVPTKTPPLKAEWIEELSSPGRDVSPAFTKHGDFVYFSSDRDGGFGGYDIYRARVIDGEIQDVQNVGRPVSTRRNEWDPALHSHGFAMAFSSDRGLDGLVGRQVYETASREVEPVSDFQFLAALGRILREIWPWLLAALIGLALLAAMLYMLFGPNRDRWGLLAKCILASLAAHALLLLILSIWMMTVTIGQQRGMDALEVAVDADALASDKLATEIRENISDIKAADDAMTMDQQTLPVPQDVPMNVPAAMADAAFKVEKADIDIRIPMTEQTKPDRLKPTVQVHELAKLEFAREDIKLETARPTAKKVEAEAVVGVAAAASTARQASDRATEPTDKPMAVGRPGPAPAAEAAVVQAVEAGDVPSGVIGKPGETLAAAATNTGSVTSAMSKLDLGGGPGVLEAPKLRGKPGQGEAAVGVTPVGLTGRPTTRPSRGSASPLAGTGRIAKAGAPKASSAVKAVGGGPTAGVADANVMGDALQIAAHTGRVVAGDAPRLGGGSPQMELAPARGGKAAPEAGVSIADVAAGAGKMAGPKRSVIAGVGPEGHEDVVATGGGPKGIGKPSAVVRGGMGVDANTPRLARLSGPGDGVARRIPLYRVGGAPNFEERSRTVSPHLLRDPKLRKGLLKGLGGTEKTEAAVARALNWFTAHQEPGGNWSASKHGGKCSDDATTSLAVLCYFGWGAKHTEPGRHQRPLAKAVAWMLKNQPKNGDWTRGSGHGNGMYTHGIVTTALCEAYGLTKDPALLEPARKAVAVILRAQNKQHGGWRYTSQPSDGDTSVVGWQVMALKSARLAGIEVPEEPFTLARKWLDRVGGGTHGGLYGYASKSPTPAMVAEGLFSQQLMGLPPSLPRMKESAAYVSRHPPDTNFYACYYSCLAMYQHQGEPWRKWNPAMQKLLLGRQVKQGQHAGSWPPNTTYGSHGGRVFTTALATLSLEVYYRYLPMYQSMPKSDDKLEEGGGVNE